MVQLASVEYYKYFSVNFSLVLIWFRSLQLSTNIAQFIQLSVEFGVDSGICQLS